MPNESTKTESAECPIRHDAFNERGHLIALTDEEAEQRRNEVVRALDALLEMGSEKEQVETFERLRQAVEADRLSYRPRFQ
jgi:hypothetical protein